MCSEHKCGDLWVCLTLAHVGRYWEQVTAWTRDRYTKIDILAEDDTIFLLVQLTLCHEDNQVSEAAWLGVLWKSYLLSMYTHTGTCTHTTNAMHSCSCLCDSLFVFVSTKDDHTQTLGSSESNLWGEHIVVLRCCFPPVVWKNISFLYVCSGVLIWCAFLTSTL